MKRLIEAEFAAQFGVKRGELVRASYPESVRGVYIGDNGRSVWVRWLRRGELRTAKTVRDDVAKMSERFDAMIAKQEAAR